MKSWLLALSLALATPAMAQTDPQKMIEVLTAQRNTAFQWHAEATAQLLEARAEIDRLKARVAELEKKGAK